MIDWVDVMQKPLFSKEENVWRQVIPFSYNDQRLEVDLHYDYDEADFEFSAIYNQSTFFEESKRLDNPAVLTELLNHETFSDFLDVRQELFEEIKPYLFQEAFLFNDFSILQESSHVKVTEFTLLPISKIIWKSVLSKSVNWNCDSITVHLTQDFIELTPHPELEKTLIARINRN